jgi:Protein of unknown function (DUF2934)
MPMMSEHAVLLLICCLLLALPEWKTNAKKKPNAGKTKSYTERVRFFSLVLATALAGFAIVDNVLVSSLHAATLRADALTLAVTLWLVALSFLVLCRLCLAAFHDFASNFAATVYRDFSVHAAPPALDDIRARAYEIYQNRGAAQQNNTPEQDWRLAEEQLRG